MSFCTKCGKELNENDRFCSDCGSTISSADASEHTDDSGVKIIDVPEGDPTFRVQCEYCMCIFEYHTCNLGYRAWYPHGFIYCPRCKKPIRHRLEFRI